MKVSRKKTGFRILLAEAALCRAFLLKRECRNLFFPTLVCPLSELLPYCSGGGPQVSFGCRRKAPDEFDCRPFCQFAAARRCRFAAAQRLLIMVINIYFSHTINSIKLIKKGSFLEKIFKKSKKKQKNKKRNCPAITNSSFVKEYKTVFILYY